MLICLSAALSLVACESSQAPPDRAAGRATGPPPAARPPAAPVAPPDVRATAPAPEFWVVEKFGAAPAWSRGVSAAAGRDWGSRLTEGVARNLRLHFSRVSDANRKLTAEDIARLVGARRLNYLVGGIIESLTPPTGGSPWRLGVTYSLQRAVPGRLQLVQKERIEESSRAGAALGVSDLEVLVDGAAARIAGRLAPAITGDILAVRD